MAIAFRASSAVTNFGNAATTWSQLVPSTNVAGDLCVLLVHSVTGTPTSTTPSGWNLLPGTPINNSVDRLWFFWKILASADLGATITGTFSVSVDWLTATAAYSGTVSNLDASSINWSPDVSTRPTSASLTVALADSILIWLGTQNNNTAALTVPTGLAGRVTGSGTWICDLIPIAAGNAAARQGTSSVADVWEVAVAVFGPFTATPPGLGRTVGMTGPAPGYSAGPGRSGRR